MMKTINIFKGLITVLFLSVAVSSCESYNEALLDGIGNTREFSPIGLKATIRNSTTVELDWTAKADENADHYVVEFSADDSSFATIYKTINVAPSELPVKVALEGETVYSIRVKAVTSGLADSKWSVITATTLSEQIMFPVQDADIQATQVTLRWTPNSAVTQITAMPGNIVHNITAAEKTAGVATLTGLTPETAYTAILLNGTKKRGNATFTTGIDIGTGILIKEGDNFLQKIIDAPSGSVLVFMPGDYTAQTGTIAINKTITLRGLRPENKPKLKVNFTLANNPANASEVVNLSLIDLDLNGTGTTGGAIAIGTAAATGLGDVLISGCYVHDYPSQLIYGNASAKLKSFSVDNSIVENVNVNAGADFIDFRTTYVASVSLTKSTFDTCSSRDFIRLDAAAGLTGTGLTSTVLIDGCTIYAPTLPAASRILYIRFVSNLPTVRNTLLAVGSAVYTNSTATAVPGFANNNNFNSPNLQITTGNNRPDASATVLDPQFTNAPGGDFTVKNQTLIDRKVGDPRWLK
ncbi:Fibronectin type III domain protein [compost metagenome]